MANHESMDRGEALVSFCIPRGGEDRPVLIGVNGEFVRVRPGETVSIRRKFVEAWENAQEQERAAWKTRQTVRAAGKRALAEL